MGRKRVVDVAATTGCINGIVLFRHLRMATPLKPSLSVSPPRSNVPLVGCGYKGDLRTEGMIYVSRGEWCHENAAWLLPDHGCPYVLPLRCSGRCPKPSQGCGEFAHRDGGR